jgi:PleD family two-component response regulator
MTERSRRALYRAKESGRNRNAQDAATAPERG